MVNNYQSQKDSIYPSGKYQLESTIEKLLATNTIDFKKRKINPSKIRAIVLPHGTLNLAGPVMAVGINAIKEINPSSICIIGPSHNSQLRGISSQDGFFSTPLGETELVPAAKSIKTIKTSKDTDYSIDVLFPFLQTIFGIKGIETIPLLFGAVRTEELFLSMDQIKEHSLLVLSINLSHFLPYEQAKVVDNITLSSIASYDLDTLKSKGDSCGLVGLLAITMLAKKNNWKTSIIDYRNSGDLTGNKKSVTGFVSLVFTED